MRIGTTIGLIAAIMGLSAGLYFNSEGRKEEDLSLIRMTSSGQLLGIDHGSYQAWLGIPYAQAPLGDLRWKAPRSFDSDKLVKTEVFGGHCSQAELQFEQHIYSGVEYVGSEDCLYLNVWAPSQAKSVGDDGGSLPVMVWIHGGGGIAGSGDIDGSVLAAKQQVIVVSMNYRLGVMGWLSHAGLRETAENLDDASGNYGTLDIIQSLQWVQDNIGEFGGDPQRVTIFGLSAGGWNVFSLLNSPKASGLFHGAISHSGVPRMETPDYAERFIDDKNPGHVQSSGELLLNLLLTDQLASDRATAKSLLLDMTANDITAYLRSKSYEQLSLAQDRLAKQFADKFSAREAVNGTKLNGVVRTGSPLLVQNNHAVPKIYNDGVVLSSKGFLDAVASHSVNRVPVIFGTTRDESKLFQAYDREFLAINDGKRKIIDTERYHLLNEYVSALWKASGADEAAESFTTAGDEAYVFRFDWDSLPVDAQGENLKAIYGASHAIDFPFIFGKKSSLFSNHKFSSADRALSESLMSYWAEFAYTGKPSKGRNGELPEWKPWSNEEGSTDKTFLLDTPQKGGLRMSPIHGNRQQVLARIAKDPRVNDPKKRCRLYRDILDHSHTFLTQAEFTQLEAGLCIASLTVDGDL